jgi:hypothetical protein
MGVIAHKHYSEHDSDTVEFDLDALALRALFRAMVDYIALNGQDEPFVRNFLHWAWANTDGQALMERFKRVPERMRPQ